MGPVEVHQVADIHAGYAVSVGEQKRLIAYMFLDPLDPSSGHRLASGIDESDTPRFGMRMMIAQVVFLGEIEGDIGLMQQIVGEILFDQVSFVSEANDKLVEPVVGVYFHDVP